MDQISMLHSQMCQNPAAALIPINLTISKAATTISIDSRVLQSLPWTFIKLVLWFHRKASQTEPGKLKTGFLPNSEHTLPRSLLIKSKEVSFASKSPASNRL